MANSKSGATEYWVRGVLRSQGSAVALPPDASLVAYAVESAGYTMSFEGMCKESVASLSECTAAALALNLTWKGLYHEGKLADTAVDDERSASGSGPSGCYLEGSWSRALKYNVAGGNTGVCKNGDICLCRAYVPTTAPQSFTICRVQERVGGDVRLIAQGVAPSTGCKEAGGSWFTISNPAIDFTGADASIARAFAASDVRMHRALTGREPLRQPSLSRTRSTRLSPLSPLASRLSPPPLASRLSPLASRLSPPPLASHLSPLSHHHHCRCTSTPWTTASPPTFMSYSSHCRRAPSVRSKRPR